ncbi:MAG TPA: cupin domain-containing protein, partial [Edaphobacter sp.]|nr:cupin domain-containing protein [Edaphobacter sp.]
MLSGQLEVLVEEEGKFRWVLASTGDFVHVPSEAKHGFRNTSSEPAVSLISTTARLGHFFEEIGRPVVPGAQPAPPSPEEMQRFMETAGRYHYWMGTPDENAAVGISLF